MATEAKEASLGPLSEAAVIVVDIQKDFVTTMGLPSRFPAFGPNVERLLALCRDKGVELIHIRAVYNDDVSPFHGYMRSIASFAANRERVTEHVEDFAKEKDGETVIIKHTMDGFLNTNLLDVLKSKGKKKIFFAGCSTSLCVISTLHGAFARGFETMLIPDCCADLKPERHQMVLELYDSLWFRSVPLDDFARLLQ